MTPSVLDSLIKAARAVARAGLADAFGHLSFRLSPSELRITPPHPLATLDQQMTFPTLRMSDRALPDAAPKEAWLHLAIADRRPEIGAVCRAQPPAVAALAALDAPLIPLHGHGAFLGKRVPVYRDSRLIREPSTAALLAEALGSAPALILRGNGAVTCGPDLPSAVALMWVLEQSAQLTLAARAVGNPIPLPAEEQLAWRALGPELLPRIYAALLA